MRALPLSRTARARFRLDDVAAAAPTPAPTRPTTRLAANLPVARKVVAQVNAERRAGEPSAQAGELAALELLHEVFHLLIERAAELQPPTAMAVTADAVRDALGEPLLDGLLSAVGDEFPGLVDDPEPIRLEELLLVRLANENPAARPLRVLVDDSPLPEADRTAAIASLESYQAAQTPIGPQGETLVELLRAPARAHPTSLAGQLRYVQGTLGRAAGRRPRRAPGPDAADARRHGRGGARAPPAVRRRRRRPRRRGLRRWRGRRGAGPDRARGGAGALLERLRLDAAPGPHRQEHARLAGPAVAAVRARHPDPGRDPRR